MTAVLAGRRRAGRPALVNGLHLAVLWSLAVAQPLFDLLGRNAAFFAIRRSTSADIVIFAVALILLPPLILFLVEALLGLLDERVGRAAHLVFVAGLVGLIALDVLKRTDGFSGVLIPLAVVVGAGAAALYARVSAVRLFLTVLGPAPVLFALLFLFNTPVHKLINGSEAQAKAVGAGGRTPVVMVVFDELPVTSLLATPERIDARRYPNFATLARGSTWFRNTATVDSATEYAVPSILTGQRPQHDRLPTFEDHPHNLFTLLGGERRMHVAESITSLCPDSLCHRSRPGFGQRMRSLAADLRVVAGHVLLPGDIRRRLPSIDSQWQDFGGASDGQGGTAAERAADVQEAVSYREDLFHRFVSRHPRSRRGEPGPLSFVHAVLPHIPWQYLPDGKRYGAVGETPGLEDEQWSRDPGAAAVGFQRHLLQLGFVDRLLGELLRKLRDDGSYDQSLIVVTADHGVSFRPGQPRRAPTPGTVRDILPVPFFAKLPGQRSGRIVKTQLQTVDILPTIASILKVRIPWHVDGRSAFSPGAGRRVLTTTGVGENPVVIRSDVLAHQSVDALRRQRALLGVGGFPRLHDPATDDLVGRPLPRDVPAGGGASATVHDPSRFTAVDRRSDFLPVHVTGTVRGIQAPRIAVAVNGRIAATAPVLTTPAGRAFSVLIPPWELHDGANRVEVLAIAGRGAGRRLVSLVRLGPGEGTYTLQGGAVRSSDGRRFRIVEGALAGGVDTTLLEHDVVRLSGWAMDAGSHRPVGQIIGFDDDRLLFSGAPGGPRPDIAERYKTRPDDLGFSFDLPNADLQKRPVVFALRDGVASRLEWFCGQGVAQDIGC